MRIAALTFHDLLPNAAAASKGDEFYHLTAAEMERLLSQLRKQGYKTVHSKAFRAWQQGEAVLPERTAVFTFDDGYTSHLDIAASLLNRYRFTGTFFITTDYVGKPGYLTWDQIRKLAFLGMEIGSHGKSHKPLTRCSREELAEELAGSKRLLEAQLGVPVEAFAAPGGFWNSPVARAVQAAGYNALWVSDIGTNGKDTNPFALRRVVVRRPFALERMVAMVEGRLPAFWWAAGQQQLIKGLKQMLGVYWYERLKRRLVPNA